MQSVRACRDQGAPIAPGPPCFISRPALISKCQADLSARRTEAPESRCQAWSACRCRKLHQGASLSLLGK